MEPPSLRSQALSEAREPRYLPETEDPEEVYQYWAETLEKPELIRILQRALGKVSRGEAEHFPVTLSLDLMEWAHEGLLPLEELGMTVHPDLAWRSEIFWAAHAYLSSWRDGNNAAT